MSLIYLSKYIELENTYNLDFQLLIMTLMKPDADDDMGLIYDGYIGIAEPKLRLTNLGYTIIGLIVKNTCDFALNIGDKVDIIQLSIEHSVLIRWDMVYGNSGNNKIFLENSVCNHIDTYLLKNNYSNLTTAHHNDEQQSSMSYVRIKKDYVSNDEYKLHISCEISKWKECYDKLLHYVNENQEHICLFKFGLLSLTHVYDHTNELLTDYLDWNGGASTANFIIYFNTSRGRRISQFEFISHFLSLFIPYWTADNFDEQVGREHNVLTFNERLTKSLFITYDYDTSTKLGFVSKNEDKTINDVLEPFRNKKFTMSDELIKEKKHICSVREKDKLTSFNDCLKDKYNLSLAELCSSEMNNAHAWKEVYGYGEVTESIKMKRCYDL